MQKHTYTKSMILAQVSFIFCVVLLGLNCSTFQAGATTSDTNFVVVPVKAEAPALDAQHLYALGMIETGNDDTAVGRAGEISRYQLSPPVWKSYSKSREYTNPEIAIEVARQHWNYLADYFKNKSGRAPSDFDMYVLWNSRFGYYARKGFAPQHIAAVMQDRAQRFVNLVNRRG